MAMAVICSFTHYSRNSHLKINSTDNNTLAYTSSSYSCSTIQYEDDTLANSSHGPTSASEMEKLLDMNLFDEVSLRRKRRRRRRIELEYYCIDKVEINAFVDDKKGEENVSFMTSKEEAKFSSYLKERARIESVRTQLMSDKDGYELVSRQWANAAGISERNLDKILCNGRLSEEKINRCYKRFVISIASSYQGKGLSLKDLTQEGSIGLLRGAIKFNPEKGYKLSTYAYWWIRQAITKAIARKSRIIRLPGSIIELMPKICEANTVLSRKLQRFPTYDEIAEAINVKTSVVRLALERNRSPFSLDQAITSQLSQGSMFLQDIVAGPDKITPEVMLMKDLLKPEIQKLLKTLCDREANVIKLHYGLNGETPWSFEEIGIFLNLSRERVRQINTSALSKLRQIRGIHDLEYFV